ncbi:MAG: DUF4097 family beta strand repeat protein [Acidobacteria bacterium]|nr:DUF4097 family beta strand repeat protein [Acidobacteriota bacterium]
MKYFSGKLRYVGAACFTFVIAVSAANVFGQVVELKDKINVDKDKIKEYKGEGFCSNNNWSDDKVSFSELREMNVSAGGTIAVDAGPNGGISVRGEDRGDVLVRACVQTWGKTDAEARSLASSIRIGTAGTIKADGPTENGWSVSYQLLVPRNSSVKLNAHNGGIAISGIDGSADFATTNGGVSLSNVAGDIKGHTENGGVNVSLSGVSWKGSGLDVSTQNGGVHLSLPSNFAAHVETGTVNGGFRSDFPALTVEKDANGRRTSSRVSADINGGGPTVKVITTNGGIVINSTDKEDL